MSNYGFAMDYIDDRATYKAVMFACNLLKKGNSYTKAVGIASNYYDVNPDDVRHFLSQRSGRKQANIRSRKYKEDDE
jgi:soluble lytic murein transglycosylase-like protein